MAKDTAFDFYVVIKSPELVKNLQIFDFGGTRTTGVKGFYKTIVWFLKCLFTMQGSDVSDRTYGTTLGGLIGGNIGSRQDLVDAITLSINQATSKIQEYQQTSRPVARETLAAAALLSVSYSDTQVDAVVHLTNAAGESLTLSLPTGVRVPPTSP